MQKFILTFCCFLFSFSLLKAAPPSHQMRTVLEATELSRDYGFHWASDHVAHGASGLCIVEINYALIFDDGSKTPLYAYVHIPMGNSAARDGILPERAATLINKFVIAPGDVISFYYAGESLTNYYWITLEKNGLTMDGSVRKRHPIPITDDLMMR